MKNFKIAGIRKEYDWEEFAQSIGLILPYEHICQDLSNVSKELYSDPFLGELEMKSLSSIHFQPYSSLSNVLIGDSTTDTSHEITQIKNYNPIIIDVTSLHNGFNIKKLTEISQLSGVDILCGGSPSGKFYNSKLSDEENAKMVFNEITYKIENQPPMFLSEIKNYKNAEKIIMMAYSRLIKEQGIPLFTSSLFHSDLSKTFTTFNIDKTKSLIQYSIPKFCKYENIISECVRMIQEGFTLCLTLYSSELKDHFTQTAYSPYYWDLINDLISRGLEKQFSISNNINFKTQLKLNGGAGYSGIYQMYYERLTKNIPKDVLENIAKNNISKLLKWYIKKPKKITEVKIIKCEVCSNTFEENSNYFTKFDFKYCSMNCLREHTKRNFK